jgi:hypothetical protein
MSTKKTTNTTNTKRIHNPVTNTYYSVRVRNTSSGKKGTIIGKWSPKK